MARKNIFVFLLISFLFIIGFNFVFAVNAYLFYGNGCPHCTKASEFLKGAQSQYLDLKVYEFEVYHNKNNNVFLKEVANTLNTDVKGVPFLVIGDKYFMGYSDVMSPGEIDNRIKECLAGICPDSIASIIGVEAVEPNDPGTAIVVDDNPVDSIQEVVEDKTIVLPVFGEIEAGDFSLPILAILIGVLDGFNPCAMWVLLFLISLLLGMRNKKRMWTLGVLFIIASALVYFLFMVAWLELILFLGFVVLIRLGIGILAIFGGGYSLKEFFFNKSTGCKVMGGEKRQRVFSKIRDIVQQNSFFLALVGIIILAFAVNLVELICSAGLPVVYTQILALNNLASWQYYFYIFLYIFFFMLDDLIIFFIAMVTLEVSGITTKYNRLLKLISGIILLVVGILLIFKPEILMFG